MGLRPSAGVLWSRQKARWNRHFRPLRRVASAKVCTKARGQPVGRSLPGKAGPDSGLAVDHVVVGLLAGRGVRVDVGYVSGVHRVERDGDAEEVLAERQVAACRAGSIGSSSGGTGRAVTSGQSSWGRGASRVRIGAMSAATASRPVRGGPREKRSLSVRISDVLRYSLGHDGLRVDVGGDGQCGDADAGAVEAEAASVRLGRPGRAEGRVAAGRGRSCRHARRRRRGTGCWRSWTRHPWMRRGWRSRCGRAAPHRPGSTRAGLPTSPGTIAL